MRATSDVALADAVSIAGDAIDTSTPRPHVKAFFDIATCTISYVAHDPGSRACAVIDSVLDYDPTCGRTSHQSADRIADYVRAERLKVVWQLETHLHADHLSAAAYLRGKLGGRLAIGQMIVRAQERYGALFNVGAEFRRDGSQFDCLFGDGARFAVGEVQAIALHAPGHTLECMAYVIGDAVFVGDTMLMPDFGSARCDFPGGDAAMLYRSIRRLLKLPDDTRVFACHDYKAPGRDLFAWETTIGAQRRENRHIREGVGQAEFVALREARDRTLAAPRLLQPSVRANMRGVLSDPAQTDVCDPERFLDAVLSAR